MGTGSAEDAALAEKSAWAALNEIGAKYLEQPGRRGPRHTSVRKLKTRGKIKSEKRLTQVGLGTLARGL